MIHKVEKDAWKPLSQSTHMVVFGNHKPSHVDRIDFTLVVANAEGAFQGYVTCREIDSETLYWQYGGAFPGTRGTYSTFWAYKEFVEWCRGKYKRITTLIENTNIVMLKMAMQVGFRIIGIRNFKSSIMLEHLLEF